MSKEEGQPIQYYNLNGLCRLEFGDGTKPIPYLTLNRQACLGMVDVLLQHLNSTRSVEKPIAPVIDLRLVKRPDPEQS